MQVNCRHCHRPYAVNRDQVIAFLDEMVAENLKYQNSFCPHCGKRNRHTKKQLQQSVPAWRPGESAKS